MEKETRQIRIVGVILAGGASRRMGGGDKGLLPFGGTTLLGEVVRRLAPQVDAVVINANGDPRRFAALGLPVVPDTIEGQPGPLAGILTGMRWAAANVPGATHVLSVSSDAPFLPLDLASRLADALSSGKATAAVAASSGHVHPVIGLWPVLLADDLDRTLAAGARQVRAWAARHGAVTVDFPLLRVAREAVDPFFNANTPPELDEARRLRGLFDA